MFRLGWETYRQVVREVVSPARARRAFGIAVVCTVLAAVAMTALEAAVHWTGHDAPGAAVVIALLSLGVGSVAFACCPVAAPIEPRATINGRQVRPDTARTVRWSVQRYLGARPPAIAPEDRDAVLVDTTLFRRGVTLDLTRGTALITGGILATIGGASVGFTHLWPVFMLAYAGNLPSALLRLGRAERARRAAEALTPRP